MDALSFVKGGQCRFKRLSGSDYCGLHKTDRKHGRVDEDVPADMEEQMRKRRAKIEMKGDAPAVRKRPASQEDVVRSGGSSSAGRAADVSKPMVHKMKAWRHKRGTVVDDSLRRLILTRLRLW